MDKVIIELYKNKLIEMSDNDEEIFISLVNDLFQMTYLIPEAATNKNAFSWLQQDGNFRLISTHLRLCGIEFKFDRKNNIAYIKQDAQLNNKKYTFEQSKIFFAIVILYQMKKNCASSMKHFSVRFSELREHLIVSISLGKDAKKVNDNLVKETLKIMKNQNLVDIVLKDLDEEDFNIVLLKTLEYVFSDEELIYFTKLLDEKINKGGDFVGNI